VSISGRDVPAVTFMQMAVKAKLALKLFVAFIAVKRVALHSSVKMVLQTLIG